MLCLSVLESLLNARRAVGHAERQPSPSVTDMGWLTGDRARPGLPLSIKGGGGKLRNQLRVPPSRRAVTSKSQSK